MRVKTLLKISAFAIAVPLTSAIAVDTASAGCRSGYVWRDAKDGDGVCVTPQERADAKLQNANARKTGRSAAGPTDQTPAARATSGAKRSPAMSSA